MYSTQFDPADLSEHALVPFEVRTLENARLLWLNERWLIESGRDPRDTTAREAFAAKLMRDFAVTSAPPGAGDGAATLFADLYGGSGGEIHGGSGRCGSRDGFIAKGIGRTPLTAAHADVYHRNGYMSLGEAIREAVSGEILGRELPWGAMPVVAIIDAGFSFPYGPDGVQRRAAIAVRPSFIRPAHFERSIFFGNGGRPDSAQFRDALRVRDAVRRASRHPERYTSPFEMFTRFAQQIGAARAQRLWLGRFLTSNIAIDGALVDFGAFRAVPNWRRIVGLAGENFGAELQQLRHGFLSVASYFGKYSPESLEGVDVRAYLRRLEEIEQRSFVDTCMQQLGAHDDALAPHLVGYYRQQQARVTGVDVAAKCPWIHDALSRRAPRPAPSGPEQAAERALLDALARSRILPARALHFFRPRTRLTYDVADKAARRVERLVTAQPGTAAALVSACIDRQVGASFNDIRYLPPHLEPESAVRGAHSAVITCRQRDGGRAFWVEAARHEDRLFISGQPIALESLDYPPASLQAHRAGIELPAGQWRDGHLRVGDCELRVAERAS